MSLLGSDSTNISSSRADVLAFVPGVAEIDELTLALKRQLNEWDVVPLHSLLEDEAQREAHAVRPRWHETPVVANEEEGLLLVGQRVHPRRERAGHLELVP